MGPGLPQGPENPLIWQQHRELPYYNNPRRDRWVPGSLQAWVFLWSLWINSVCGDRHSHSLLPWLLASYASYQACRGFLLTSSRMFFDWSSSFSQICLLLLVENNLRWRRWCDGLSNVVCSLMRHASAVLHWEPRSLAICSWAPQSTLRTISQAARFTRQWHWMDGLKLLSLLAWNDKALRWLSWPAGGFLVAALGMPEGPRESWFDKIVWRS